MQQPNLSDSNQRDAGGDVTCTHPEQYMAASLLQSMRKDRSDFTRSSAPPHQPLIPDSADGRYLDDGHPPNGGSLDDFFPANGVHGNDAFAQARPQNLARCGWVQREAFDAAVLQQAVRQDSQAGNYLG